NGLIDLIRVNKPAWKRPVFSCLAATKKPLLLPCGILSKMKYRHYARFRRMSGGNLNFMIKEIIVVEGKDDTVSIKRAVEADTIETGGSALHKRTIERIRLAQERRGVIIFTDPDYAGERIRKLISQKVPGCKHAFITQEDACYKDDIGVENASPE